MLGPTPWKGSCARVAETARPAGQSTRSAQQAGNQPAWHITRPRSSSCVRRRGKQAVCVSAVGSVPDNSGAQHGQQRQRQNPSASTLPGRAPCLADRAATAANEHAACGRAERAPLLAQHTRRITRWHDVFSRAGMISAVSHAGSKVWHETYSTTHDTLVASRHKI